MAKSGSKRRAKRSVAKATVHIRATFNNTIVTITDMNGDVLCWSSAGSVPVGGGEKKFSGARKSTPFAAQRAAQFAANEAKKHGVMEVEVRVKGPGRRPRVGDHRVAGGRHFVSSRSRTSRRCRTTVVARVSDGGV